jgi:hypothetical protein
VVWFVATPPLRDDWDEGPWRLASVGLSLCNFVGTDPGALVLWWLTLVASEI